MQQKNKYYILLFTLFAHLNIFSQDWYPVNFPTDTAMQGDVFVLYEYKGELYIGGWFIFSANGIKTYSIVKWDGSKWDSLGRGIDVAPQNGIWSGGQVRSIKAYNNELYVSGDFNYAGYGNMPKIAKWNGNQWQIVNTVYYGPTINMRAMEVYKGKLYLGGNFYYLNSIGENLYVDCCIGVWDGNQWDSVSAGSLSGVAQAMTLFKSDLYVGGQFWYAGNVPVYSVARYDGFNWYPLELGVDGPVSALVNDTVNGYLYVGGAFYNYVKSDGASVYVGGIARWNGQSWSAIPDILDSGFTVSLCIYHGKLYTGSGSTWVSAWNGKEWEHPNGPTNTVFCLGIYQDTLYVGGLFKSVVNSQGDTLKAYSLARYWTPNYCDSLHAVLNISTDTVSITAGDSIQVSSTGYSNQWEWDFGTSSGSAPDTAQSPYHVYDSAGLYTLKLRATYGLCPWDWDSVVVSVWPVGIADAEETPNYRLQIYPNPTKGSFVIEVKSDEAEGKSHKVEIYDIKGVKVHQSEIRNSKLEITTQGWAKGSYFITLVKEGKVLAREKVVVE
jgi:hypothetical protein